MHSRQALVFLWLGALALEGCGQPPEPPQPPPRFISVTPSTARPGDNIVVRGVSLGNSGKLVLDFGTVPGTSGEPDEHTGREILTSSWTPAEVHFVVPADFAPGDKNLSLMLGNDGLLMLGFNLKVVNTFGAPAATPASGTPQNKTQD